MGYDLNGTHGKGKAEQEMEESNGCIGFFIALILILLVWFLLIVVTGLALKTIGVL